MRVVSHAQYTGPRDFCALNVGAIDIERVKEVTYLAVILDEKLNWHKQNENICKSLLQFFGLFNHIKSFVTKSIARLLYFACTYSRIKYGIEIFGSCSKQILSKIQVMQNELLKILLNLNRHTPTTELHKTLSILKVEDISKSNILSFVNECRSGRCSPVFCDYFSARISDYKLRLNDRLDIPHARMDMGLNRCDVIGARLWNKHLELTNKYPFKKSFRKQISKVLIENYR